MIITRDIELPIIMHGQCIGHLPDVGCKLDIRDGQLIEVEVVTDHRHVGPPIKVDDTAKGINERALWVAACAIADRPDVRRLVEEDENGKLPAHIMREHVPIYISGRVG